MRLAAAVALSLLLSSCASQSSQRPAVPEWERIPAGVVEALCQRLRMDAIATGSLAIVRVTQPLISESTVAALGGPRSSVSDNQGPFTNRAIPIDITGSRCAWRQIDVREMMNHRDEMIVEMSAPVANPYYRGEAAVFARVTLAGAHPAWYWVALARQGDAWGVRRVYVLSQ